MEASERVLEIVAESSAKYADDVTKAIDDAERKVRKLPEFPSLVSNMVRGYIQDLVYDARHATKRQMKKEHGQYGGPSKVIVGSSKIVNEVSLSSLYQLPMDGTILGLIFGSDLVGIAEREQSKADGHDFNARLCLRLAPLVPKNKRVQEAVTEKVLKTLYDQVVKGEASPRPKRKATGSQPSV
jgi:hypothetical protein